MSDAFAEEQESFSGDSGRIISKPYFENASQAIQVPKIKTKATFLSGRSWQPIKHSGKSDLESVKETQMAIEREELNAKLAQNKAEVESVAAAMRTEMANFRTAYVESFKDISITLNKLDAKSDATEKRLTQAQWIVSLVISISAVTLSAVIYFSNKANTKPIQQQPAVVVNTQAPSTNAPPASVEQKK
ncbi:hypothetical protein [Pantoea dispersa]|uniref:hypothetical protein n=1 Tax=Pantoea dispersa TaxID=59814 RepID=UPI003017C633